jgi:hypothetical protein
LCVTRLFDRFETDDNKPWRGYVCCPSWKRCCLFPGLMVSSKKIVKKIKHLREFTLSADCSSDTKRPDCTINSSPPLSHFALQFSIKLTWQRRHHHLRSLLSIANLYINNLFYSNFYGNTINKENHNQPESKKRRKSTFSSVHRVCVTK